MQDISKRLARALTAAAFAGLLLAPVTARAQNGDSGQNDPGALPSLVKGCIATDIPATQRVKNCTDLLWNPVLNKEGRITALTFRAAALMDVFDFSGAVADFTRGLDLAPNNIGLMHGRAQALERMGRYHDALLDYDTAIQIAPDSPALFTGRALIHAQLDNMDAAFRDLEKSRKLAPRNVETLALMGGLYTETGDFDKAIGLFDKAIELRPEIGRLYLRRGLARMKAGEWDESLADLTVAIEKENGLPDAYMLRAMVHRDADRDDLALADYSAAIDGDPTLAGAWQGRGVLYMDMKEYDRARNDMDVAAQIAPTADNLNSLAWLLVSAEDKEFRDPAAALNYVNQSMELDENADNVDTAAAAYVLLGDIDNAARFYARSMELGGDKRVLIYQEYLSERGFYDGALDGIDGPRTRKAIRSFASQGRVLLVD
ncbi:MAG: tetratricopeptide repeat protein [Pseudomonadota bacterium]|nr:tetratricopeptide repeat protein [Pseudomonadota bacterium]